MSPLVGAGDPDVAYFTRLSHEGSLAMLVIGTVDTVIRKGMTINR